jgi:DNA-binding NtrC family response regulator
MDNAILLVDDETNVVSSLKRALMDEPYNIFTASSGVEGLSILKENRIKLVISDEKMPGMSGSEFLSAVKKLFPDAIRIILTGHASIQAAMTAINKGEIYRFFAKPWNEIELKLAIRSAIEKYDLEEENKRLLKTVKRQASEIQQLEKSYPGITSMQKDTEGNLVLPEISVSDGDMSDFVAQIERQLKAKGDLE